MQGRDVDIAGTLQDRRDDAAALLASLAPAGKPGDGLAQIRIGGHLLHLLAPLRDPLIEYLDLGVEQGLQAGGTDFPQRVADAAIGPQADAEDGGEQQEQGEARPRGGGVHESSLSADIGLV